MKIEIVQNITNHPEIPGVTRSVYMEEQRLSAVDGRMVITLKVKYHLDGNELTSIKQPTNTFITIEPDELYFVRDFTGDFSPMPNPEWDGVDPDTEFLTITGVELISELIFNSIMSAEVLKAYILLNASQGYFDY